jgi:hypothetical protein
MKEALISLIKPFVGSSDPAVLDGKAVANE